jgi:N-acetyl-alpha-D-glucosaminyl L-malate synthase BshA
MKIGIVCYPTFGGSGVVATELGKALAAKGNEVHFITYNMPVRLDDTLPNIFYHEVTIADYPLFDYTPYELALTSKLIDVIKYEELDILHVHYAIPHASAAYMAQHILEDQGIKIPFVTTLHGTDITLVGRDPSIEPVITFSINHSNAVTAVSESLKQDTLDHFKITKQINVVPNFVCLDGYTNVIDEDLRKQFAPNGEKIIMHISNFRKVKRVEDVAKAFEKIHDKIPSVLLFVGDGPERHAVEVLCRELKTCSKTKFLGKIKSVNKLLSIADLFILPSETESFGLAALEAMASGVPVISTNTGGLPEVNEHGVSGYMTSVGDIEGLAKYSIDILKDDAVLNTFKKNARLQAEKFDIKRVLPLYENIYQSLLDN